MKKTRSLLALLLLGSMVLAGCGKDKNDSIPGGTDTPSQPSGSGDGGSGSGGSGDGGTGGEGGQQQPGGGGEQGGGQQGGGGQGGEGGGGQGGEGGGGGEQQQGSRFVGKKLTIADAKDQYGQPLDNAVRDSILNSYGDGWVSLFDNFKFELVNPLPTTSYDVVKGNYEVANNDTSCVLTTSKIFSGEHQVYSYEIPTEMASFTITYSLNTQQYSVSMSEETGPDEYFFFTLILQAADASPEPVNIPEDPNGEDFDPRYQVTEDQWNSYFNSDGEIVTKNFTVSTPIKFGDQTIDTDTWEVDNGKLHYFSASNALLDYYYQIKSPIRDEHNIIQGFNTYTCYQTSEGVWALNDDGGVDLGQLIHNGGLLQFDPSNFTYSNFESTHYYYRNSLTVSCDFDDAGHNLTNIKVWFNSGKLSRVEYTEDGDQKEFTFSKQGTTSITFPLDIPQGGGEPQMTASYSEARSEFFDLTGIQLPELEGLTVQDFPYEHGVTTSYCFDIIGGANLEIYGAFKNFFDAELSLWDRTGPTDEGPYTTYVYTNGSGDQIQLIWDATEFAEAIYINFIANTGGGGGGGDPQPVHNAPFMQYKTTGDWQYSTLVEDPGDATQYKVAEITLVEGEEFVFCIDDTDPNPENHDWRHFSDVHPTYSYAYDDFESSGTDNNIKVKEGKGGVYDIYIKKTIPNPYEENIFINRHLTIDPSYSSAKASFEAASGITVPDVYGLGASYLTDPIRLYTNDGATTDTVALFVAHFASTLNTWNHVGPEDTLNGLRHTYTNENGDEVQLEFYDYGAGNSYLVVSYTPFVPYLHYGSGSTWYDEAMPASGPYLAKIEHFYLYEDDEFVICISDGTWLHYEDYDNDPDTAGGMITQGEGSVGSHNFHVEEDGYYDIRVDEYRAVIIEHETSGGGGGGEPPQPVAWPTTWANSLLTAWNITNDVIPSIDLTGVTSVLTDPETPTDSDDAATIILANGEDLYDTYIAALEGDHYSVMSNGMYASDNHELMFMVMVSSGNLLIGIFPYEGVPEITYPALVYYDGYEMQSVTMQHDDGAGQYYIEDVVLYSGYEFFFAINETTQIYFANFQIGDPDTAQGHVGEGNPTTPGNYTYLVDADGCYDFYVKDNGEVYIVYDMIPVLQYGLGSEWDTEKFVQANGQFELTHFYLEEGQEVVIQTSALGEYGVWLHFADFEYTEFSTGKIGDAGNGNLKILVDGYYNFYVTGGKIYVTYSAE